MTKLYVSAWAMMILAHLWSAQGHSVVSWMFIVMSVISFVADYVSTRSAANRHSDKN